MPRSSTASPASRQKQPRWARSEVSQLRNVDDLRIIPQPLNRGTGVAVAVALLHILRAKNPGKHIGKERGRGVSPLQSRSGLFSRGMGNGSRIVSNSSAVISAASLHPKLYRDPQR